MQKKGIAMWLLAVIFYSLVGLLIIMEGRERDFIHAVPRIINWLTIFGIGGIIFFKEPVDLYCGIFVLATFIFIGVFMVFVTFKNLIVDIFSNY